jgi:predicted ATPase/DNA-binding SARP family transcriptional activator
VQISLFGGVQATTDGGAPIDVGPAKSQAVLAALALSVGSAVPVAHLVEQVWGEDPPRKPEKTLQWYVAQLRKALGPEAIERVGAAYRLAVPAEAVDIVRFLRHLDVGDVDAALQEWTGTPLAGLDVPGLSPIVDGLVERWLDATERSLELRVEADPGPAAGTLIELTARHPFREGLWALLMTALHRSGRQAEALAAFRTARRLLIDELGVEPGARLREVEALVLSGGAADSQAVSSLGSAASMAVESSGLPTPLTPLIGREAALAAVADALTRSRLVTIVGPGGIGKTRLSLAAARVAVHGAATESPAARKADAAARDVPAVFVDLAQVTASSQVARSVADALDIREQEGRTLTGTIVQALQAGPALLVIDNCEHVVDGAAALVEAITERCAQVRIIATSREPLAVGGEHSMTLGSLATTAAAQLFSQRAAAAGIDVSGDRDDVLELCRRLDGVPLAIELAAARTPALTPEELLARLDDSLRLLTGGRRTSGGRHRTLRAAIRWSFDLLSEPEQALLQRLSVFAGPFPLRAAEGIAAHMRSDVEEKPLHVDELLGRLVERSMVLVDSAPAPGLSVPGRWFRLLETVRQFVRDELVAEGAAEGVAARHAGWYRDEVAEVGALLSGPAEADGVARLAQLWPNLRAAVGWACTTGDRELALGLVRPVVTEIALRGRQEIGDWVERVAALATDDEDAVAWGLLWASQRYVQSGDPASYERLAAHLGEPDHPLARYALAYAEGRADQLAACAPGAVATAATQSGAFVADLLELSTAGILLGAGRFADVDATVEALAERQRAAGRPTLLHWSLSALAYSASLQGDLARADRLYDEAADAEVPAGTLSANKPIQARGAFRRGQRQRGLRILRDAIDEVLVTGNLVAAGVVAVEFVNMMAALGRFDDAARLAAYLESSNAFAARAATSLLSEAARSRAVAAAKHQQSPPANDRQALEAMRAVLDALA